MIAKLLSLLGWWAYLIVFCAGVAVGGGAAWYVQGVRLQSVKNDLKKVTDEYAAFVDKTKQLGDEAKKKAQEREEFYQNLLEQKDHETTAARAAARSANQRLHQNRARGGYLPENTTGAGGSDRICFYRSKLGAAIQQLDGEVSVLIAEGDDNTVRLAKAREWALELQQMQNKDIK